MYHVPIIKTTDRKGILDFSHFDHTIAGQNVELPPICDHAVLNFFIDGNILIFTDGKWHKPLSGDLFLFSPDRLHHQQTLTPTHVNYYQLDFGRSALDGIPDGNALTEQLLSAVQERSAFLRPPPQSGTAFFSLFAQIESCIQTEAFAMAYAKVVELISMLYLLYSCAPVKVDTNTPSYPARVIRAIEERYRESLTIATLSQELEVSVSYLARSFKKETGLGIHEYLNRYRIMKAMPLLAAHSVTQVGVSCGFGNTSNFVSVFKKHLGITPMQYKRQQSHF